MSRNRFKPVHGHASTGKKSPTYLVWESMRTRCNLPSASNYQYYGGRGIRVCERWDSYQNFLADMGERPAGKTLDRWPNKDGHYELGNCRWATKREQRANQREYRRAPRLTREQREKIRADAQTLSLADFVRLYRVSSSTIQRVLAQ